MPKINNNFPSSRAIKRYKHAVTLAQKGEVQRSIQILRELIESNPQWGGPLYLICELILKDEVHEPINAEPIFARINQDPFKNDPMSLYLLAWAAEKNEDYALATRFIEKALKKSQNFRAAFQKLAVIKIRQEKWNEAESLLRQELEIAPHGAHLLLNLSVALLRQNKLKDSLEIALQAERFAQDEQKQAIYVNLGSIYQELNERQKALSYYTKAIQIDSNNINANLNIGVLALQQKNFLKAEKQFRRVLELNPCDRRAAINLAGLLLLQNRKKEGWEYYERRIHKNSKILDIPTNLPQWCGGELKGSLILVHEQGLGDSFQFIRYAKHLQESNIRCHFQGPKKLHRVFLHSQLVNTCITEHSSLPEDAEAWTPLMSLPRILSMKDPQLKEILGYYLKVEKNLVNKWNTILGPKRGLRFALNWQGNPQHEFTISRGRSIPLEQLTPLLNITNIEWINLQKGDGSEQSNSRQWKDRWHPEQEIINNTWGFEDTLAILSCCDGLISCDSGLAHLAGAAGNRVLLMLPWLAEWRWGANGRDSFWYPNHSLFRQTQEGDWDSVISDISAELKSMQTADY